MQLFPLIEAVFQRPPLPFDPERQSLKAWAMYCLRDRGFKVVYAQNADFAVEARDGSKVYFKVTEELIDRDPQLGWIVRDRATQQIQVIAPSTVV